jgi:hypothetical protein
MGKNNAEMSNVEKLYRPDLIMSVGHVVMAAALAEDTAGELIELVARIAGHESDVPAKGWAATGSALIAEIKKVVGTELVDRMVNALQLRNDVVHGIFIGMGANSSGKSGMSGPFMSMKRDLNRSKPAQFLLKDWSVESLNALAIELCEIEELLGNEISITMKTRRPKAKK